MFDIRRLPKGVGFVTPVKVIDLPNVIEGAEVFDTLCPVSKLTGFRENPVTLLSKVLDPAKARLIDAVLQEIPTLADEGGKISDSDALDLCMDRLATGSPAEDALVRKQLSSMLDVLIPVDIRKDVDQTIQFEQADAQQTDSDS